MRILVTGGCGFIGHHFVDYVLRQTRWSIAVLDKLSYACNGLDRLREIGAIGNDRVTVFPVDFSQALSAGVRKEIGPVDYIVHLGAASHVDNSIADPVSFVEANVLGTTHLLEYARTLESLDRMLYFSTDEVFGPAAAGTCFKEWDRYNSCNPYAATKAGAEEMCLAYANTYDVPVMVSHAANVFGERQHPEKFIPLVVDRVLRGEVIPIHTDPETEKPCSRSYIYVRNVADAILFLLLHGEVREKYNIAGQVEIDNLTLAQKIAWVIGKPLRFRFEARPQSRPGHDVRYSIGGSSLERMGWRPGQTGDTLPFEEALKQCVRSLIDGDCKRDEVKRGERSANCAGPAVLQSLEMGP